MPWGHCYLEAARVGGTYRVCCLFLCYTGLVHWFDGRLIDGRIGLYFRPSSSLTQRITHLQLLATGSITNASFNIVMSRVCTQHISRD